MPTPLGPETDPVGDSLPNDYDGLPDDFEAVPNDEDGARVCNDDCCPAEEAGEVISEGTDPVE